MSVNDFDSLADYYVPENREEGEHRGKRCLTVNDKEWHIVDFDSVGEVSHSSTPFVGMSDDNYFVATINQFLDQVRCAFHIAQDKGSRSRADTCDFQHRLRIGKFICLINGYLWEYTRLREEVIADHPETCLVQQTGIWDLISYAIL